MIVISKKEIDKSWVRNIRKENERRREAHRVRRRIFEFRQEQKMMGDILGIHVGDFVRRPDNYDDSGGYPKCGQKLKVSHLFSFGFGPDRFKNMKPEDIWVSVVYPDNQAMTDPYYSDRSMPVYTDWVKWDRRA